MGQFSLTHIMLLVIILLVFFGPSKLPQLGQSIGKAIRGFKQGLNEIDAEVKPVPDKDNAQLQNQSGQQESQKTSEKNRNNV